MISRLAALLRGWSAHRRFNRLPRADRRIVLYSESGQDWHHFRPVVEHLTGVIGASICYVSSDPQDPGLHQDNPRIRGFCIGQGLVRIWFFQFLRCDLLLTQMLDLGNFDLKRSIHPVHFVYMFHSLISTHMADHEDSFDHYDTILYAGPHQAREIRRREEMKGLKPKRLVPHGYHRIEQLMAERREPPPIRTDAYLARDSRYRIACSCAIRELFRSVGPLRATTRKVPMRGALHHCNVATSHRRPKPLAAHRRSAYL